MTVLLPEQTTTQIGVVAAPSNDPPPALYLLHGLGDDDTTWVHWTSIERYVAPLGLAVVMPQVHRSFYADQPDGGRYWTFLSEELPALVASMFRVSQRREDTFVAGLSMGGYGAFKWALRQPERFAAAASLSGVLDIASLKTRGIRTEEDPRLFERVFGDRDLAGTDDDLLALLDQADLPALYQCCGTEDPLIDDNYRFREACTAGQVPLTSHFSPGGHEWGYWDREIQTVLTWMVSGRETAPPDPAR